MKNTFSENNRSRKGRALRAAALLLAVAVLAVSLSACGGKDAAEGGPEGKAPLRIVATVFPLYDWTRRIIEGSDNAELTLLIESGVDMHSFQPSAGDILTVKSCDVFIYVGGESDAWAGDALRETVNKDLVAVDLLEMLGSGAREERDTLETDSDGALDEHVWLSVRNAEFFTAGIAGILSEADPENSAIYAVNAAAYIKELDELDKACSEAVSEASARSLVFADRFPFLYFAEDYGLECFAAFPGCSAESEASFETVRALAAKVDELGLSSVMTIDGSDGKLARTVVQNTESGGQRILSLDSMQSKTMKDVQSGVTYVSVMKDNISVLREALGLE